MNVDNTVMTGISVLVRVAVLIIAVMIHEVAHGYVANRLGDPTAKNAGRLTLNPLKHIDPFGSVLLPLLMSLSNGPIFGYAKPVPYNPNYFKDVRKGELLVAFSGPGSNLAQALIGAVACHVLNALYSVVPTGATIVLQVLYFVFATYVLINLVLMFFNIIPLPPLDGSAIIAPFLPDKWLMQYYKIQQYSLFILLAILFLIPAVSSVNPLGAYLSFTVNGVYNLIMP